MTEPLQSNDPSPSTAPQSAAPKKPLTLRVREFAKSHAEWIGIVVGVIGLFSTIATVLVFYADLKIAINENKAQMQVVKLELTNILNQKMDEEINRFKIDQAQQKEKIFADQKAFVLLNQLRSNNCDGRYEAAVAAFNDAKRTIKFEAISAELRSMVYSYAVIALANNKQFSQLTLEDVDTLANSITKSDVLCISVSYELAILYLSIHQLEKAKKYAIAASEQVQRVVKNCGFDLNSVLALVIICELANEKYSDKTKRAKAAMEVMESLITSHSVSSSQIVKIIEENSELVKVVARYEPLLFRPSLELFIKEYLVWEYTPMTRRLPDGTLIHPHHIEKSREEQKESPLPKPTQKKKGGVISVGC